MDNAMRRLCTICARGGSKGIPGKNLRPLMGRPLIAHSVEQAKASGVFDIVAVSSDDDRIREAGLEAGADLSVERPAELASDQAGKLPAIRHCLLDAEKQAGRFDTLVDLDVTSPLRHPSDIAEAVRMLEEEGAGNVITGAPARRSPYFNLVEVGADGVARLSKPPATGIERRQDSPDCYDMNASIYVWNRDRFLADPVLFDEGTRLYVMPPERSHDIDEALDFEIVEFLMSRNRR